MKFRDASEVEKQTEMVPSVRAQVTYESEGKIRYVLWTSQVMRVKTKFCRRIRIVLFSFRWVSNRLNSDVYSEVSRLHQSKGFPFAHVAKPTSSIYFFRASKNALGGCCLYPCGLFSVHLHKSAQASSRVNLVSHFSSVFARLALAVRLSTSPARRGATS